MDFNDMIKNFKRKYFQWLNKTREKQLDKFLLEEHENVHQSLVSQIESKFLSEEITEYKKRFSDDTGIFRLFDVKCPLEEAKKYNQRFSGGEIAELFHVGCSPEEADRYNKRFGGIDIAELFSAKCFPEEVDKYPSRFIGRDIALLFSIGCSPEELDKYPTKDGLTAWVLYSIGLKDDTLHFDKHKKLSSLQRKILNFILKYVYSEKGHYNQFSFLGTGISGIVLLKEQSAWKFSEEINKEHYFLKKIQDYHGSKQKNILKIKGEPLNKVALELEYIGKDSLESILKKQSFLPKDKAVKYASDIMNGLIEMRQSGVLYHRDIRPANILINKQEDSAVIIDFGIATTNRKALPHCNRRYGGYDLISLGQLMYKMITGEHIFAESKSMEKTTFAQKIKDYRDRVYSDRAGTLLKKHLEQIDEKIQDEKLKMLIKSCLTAKKEDYAKIQQMFKEFY